MHSWKLRISRGFRDANCAKRSATCTKQKQFDRKFSKYGKRSMESLSSNAKVNSLVYDYLKSKHDDLICD